jgi:hypothetical protein
MKATPSCNHKLHPAPKDRALCELVGRDMFDVIEREAVAQTPSMSSGNFAAMMMLTALGISPRLG